MQSIGSPQSSGAWGPAEHDTPVLVGRTDNLTHGAVVTEPLIVGFDDLCSGTLGQHSKISFIMDRLELEYYQETAELSLHSTFSF